MNLKTTARRALTSVRHHPGYAAGICVPLVAASVFTGAQMASARPGVTLAVSAAELHAAPGGHILDFGADPVKPVTGLKPGAVDVKVPDADGCDSDYGAPNLCVPWKIPGLTSAAKCGWLRSMGFGPLKVYGVNRQHLAENARGYVCASRTWPP